ncbi:MAG: TraR/DksA family transcriptional regulator [Acidimicrobiales bacterium]|nr:TraR/DksA family transcriptional regulator [Acidimicrobiales bacterium]
MADKHAEIRAEFEKERAHLLERIDELTVGGEIDLDFDDDFADRGQVASEKGEHRVLADTLEAQLKLVEKALARLDEGTYGTCSVCDKPISAERLEVLPATDRCIDHA